MKIREIYKANQRGKSRGADLLFDSSTPPLSRRLRGSVYFERWLYKRTAQQQNSSSTVACLLVS